jgi:hypothetical protein
MNDRVTERERRRLAYSTSLPATITSCLQLWRTELRCKINSLSLGETYFKTELESKNEGLIKAHIVCCLSASDS